MRHNRLWYVSALVVLACVTAGCDKLGFGHQASEPDGAPTEQELRKISYLSSANSGPNGRKVYEHLEQAKTCADLELAMRWNRPPNAESGPFHQKMAFLTSGFPADLSKGSEVFITARIESGDALSIGGEVWFLRMPDGTRFQAVEMADFWEKQALAAEGSKVAAIVKPGKPGRALCLQGVYQGVEGKHPDQDTKIPLVSVMFAMDRNK